jgi:HPt (histidine-containing phosphotransfer) domain-containing protein
MCALIALPITMSSHLWNKAEALDRVGGDEELLQDLFKIFLEEFPKVIQKLQQAIADENPDEVMRAAHGIKGEVSYLSAQHAVDLARELEDMGHKKSLSGARDLVQGLERELGFIQDALRDSLGVQQ